MPSSPWAWAATLRPARWASSTMAASSSSEYCWAPAGPVWDITPPEAHTLINSGAVLDLVADGLADLAHAVGDALFDGEGHDVRCEGLEHGRIEVTAGRGDGVAGRDDTGAFEPAEVDGLHEGDVQEEPAGLDEETEVAHGGEPGPERPPGVGHGPQGAEGRVVLDGVEGTAVVGAAEEQVDLHVHQPRDQVTSPSSISMASPGTDVGATSRMRSPATRRIRGWSAHHRRRRACGRCADGCVPGCGGGPPGPPSTPVKAGLSRDQYTIVEMQESEYRSKPRRAVAG